MRLLRPSPGEAADRQTILHLKAKYGEIKKINTKPFVDEINELQTYLDVHYFSKITDEQGNKFTELYGKLASKNKELWLIEDEVRLRIKQGEDNTTRLSEIAKLVPKLNDERAAFVQEINAIFSITEVEKVYLATELRK